jgi:hypothetical protein
VPLLVPLFILGTLVVTAGVIRVFLKSLWSPMASRYPARPVLASAISRGCQSITLHGWAGFNGCLTIAVDEQHLHVIPWRMLHFIGATPISIPWDAITDVRPSWPKSYSKALVGGVKFQAPAWCLELAQPVSSGAADLV